jgi:hypothetical protein
VLIASLILWSVLTEHGEVGDPVAVGVALKNRNSERTVIEIIESSGDAVEGRDADEARQIVVAGRSDGVDAAEIDPVDAGGKSADPVLPSLAPPSFVIESAQISIVAAMMIPEPR